jgi:uncharacterized SAM-binding protein YcdF (DUF218 family)
VEAPRARRVVQPASAAVARRSSVRRFRAVATAAALALALGLVCFLFPRQILCVQNENARADAIVVLGGDFGERSTHAAELFRSGAAPKIIVSGAGDCTYNMQVLRSAGVPASAIEVEGRSMSTRENAEFSIPLLRAEGAKRVIIVTSWYHSRRALHCFRHYAPEMQFYSRPSLDAYARSDWRRAGTWRYIDGEYVKLVGYWICYGICPL